MSVLRHKPKGARVAPFGFVLCLLALNPTETGYQDIASLLARQPGVAERWQQHLFANSRTTLQVASFNLPRPIGTSLPEAVSVRLANLDRGADVTGSLSRNPLGQMMRPWRPSDFPRVVRATKGDRLPVRVQESPEVEPEAKPESPAMSPVVPGAKTVETAPLDAELEAALNSPRLPQYEVKLPSETPSLDATIATVDPNAAVVLPAQGDDPLSFKTSTLYFGNGSLGMPAESLESWRPGEEPIIVGSGADPDMKKPVSLTPPMGESAGESVASKGEVTGPNQRPRTPAERLKLDEKARAKAEKCLAEAVYFEARGEAVRGQIAVAQVVVNRVFSGYYPTTICGVVYQNSNRHLACQFTFACDGIRDVVREPDMWDRAKKIAKETLDGRIWLPEVGKSTHYHAYWVRPSWVHEMKKMYRFGVHTFYRPRAWGDGSDAPAWGTPAQTAAISAELSAEKP